MSIRQSSTLLLRGAAMTALLALGACQSLGGDADQRAFVAAHVVKADALAGDQAFYLAQDGAYVRTEADGARQVAFAAGSR